MSERVTGLRREGQERFAALGLPSRKIEDWHYTDLSQSGVNDFAIAEPVAVRPVAGAIHLVNGYVANRPAELPTGVTLERLETSAEGQTRIGTLHSGAHRALTALNAGLFADALVLKIAAGAKLAEPIEIVTEGIAPAAPGQFHGRLLIILDEGAEATLRHTHRGEGRYFANWVIEAWLGEDAKLHHVVLQDEPMEATNIVAFGCDLASRARYHGVTLHLGGKLVRHEVLAQLSGEGADFVLEGATLAFGRQHIDNTTRIIHRAPSCASRQLFKTVIDEEGHGVFQGTVLVERPAQKTAAYQLSRALMLSDKAAMDNKPELEIFADDVKCGHGATVGDIDGTALFYLRSRGIDDATARRLLIEAFVGEIADAVEDEGVRVEFRGLLETRLTGHTGGRQA